MPWLSEVIPNFHALEQGDVFLPDDHPRILEARGQTPAATSLVPAQPTLAAVLADPSNAWQNSNSRDFGSGPVQSFITTSGDDAGNVGGYYVGDPSNQIQNYDPATNTYTQAVSTPDQKQARQRFNLDGTPAGPVEYAWHNPLVGFDGVSGGGVNERGNVQWSAVSPGSGWDRMTIHTSDLMDPGLALALGLAGGFATGFGGLVSPDASSLAGAGDMFGSGSAYNAGVETLGTGTAGGVAGGVDTTFLDNPYPVNDGTVIPDPNYTSPAGDVYLPSGPNGTLQAATTVASTAATAGGGGTGTTTTTTGGTTTGGTTTGTTAGSALQRILEGKDTAADWLEVAGKIAPGIAGAIGSQDLANSLENIATQSRTDRLPFLNTATNWLNNPNAYFEGPGKQSFDATLRALSVNGNPFGNATSLGIATDAGMKNWQNAVTGFGNLGLSGEDSRNAVMSNAAQAGSGVWGGLGDAAASVLTKPKTLSEMLGELGKATGGKWSWSPP